MRILYTDSFHVRIDFAIQLQFDMPVVYLWILCRLLAVCGEQKMAESSCKVLNLSRGALYSFTLIGSENDMHVAALTNTVLIWLVLFCRAVKRRWQQLVFADALPAKPSSSRRRAATRWPADVEPPCATSVENQRYCNCYWCYTGWKMFSFKMCPWLKRRPATRWPADVEPPCATSVESHRYCNCRWCYTH